MEMERSEYIIRIQNVNEMKKEWGEGLFILINEALAKFMDMDTTDVSNELDRVYRVGNSYTKHKNLPREVHIRCIRKGFRDEILL